MDGPGGGAVECGRGRWAGDGREGEGRCMGGEKLAWELVEVGLGCLEGHSSDSAHAISGTSGARVELFNEKKQKPTCHFTNLKF